MPNNCSTLIQRKQNVLHKNLRASSEGKLQNVVNETTAELRTGGTQKPSTYSSSANNVTGGSRESSAIRRSHLFANNRVQPAPEYSNGAHLPSIRDVSGSVERKTQSYDTLYTPRSKTHLVGASPKSMSRPASASISSFYNTIAKRSTENFMSYNSEIEELILPSSRQSRRLSHENNKHTLSVNQTMTKETVTPHKHTVDTGTDTRHHLSPHDNSQQQQQQRGLTPSNRLRSTMPNVQVEIPHINETFTKERANAGQLYQRRIHNNVKAPFKQKIDKYRRRSEEATQATNGNTLVIASNAGLSATTPALVNLSSTNTRPPPSPVPVRRVTSDGEIQARLDVLRLSMNSNITQTEQQQQQQQQQQNSSRNRLKSPYLYTTHQQLVLPGTPQTSGTGLRRNQMNSISTHSQHRQNNGINYRRLNQSSIKQSATNNPGNLYLAFIASRHLSTLDDAPLDYDIDHPKLLRIFSWLKNVEEYRHQQLDHDKLLIEQDQRMKEHEDDLSLYSEIQLAVDDIPANTTGKLSEKIKTMEFDN
ncbi:unnamed protein product [Rotaria magnacalcarata]|uniref:Uncharacterized protein n=1 Tax=Rotaria magnacalcarata TaxID=392030 RepID=A0A816Q099_9BILA|nr:unnamed protein product [Rotaria magnacalcarata]CAF3777844.1 unnamed protein product [Rotaria magnacalcarata]